MYRVGAASGLAPPLFVDGRRRIIVKTVIRRHAGHIQVIRACAVAQVLAKGGEVVVETFRENKPLLDLFGVAWKDPRAPYAVEERRMDGKSRPGGKIWDVIVDLDGDGPFEPRFMDQGLGFEAWVKQELNKDFPDSIANFESNPFPAFLLSPPSSWVGNMVLLAPLSADADPFDINANELSALAAKDHPGVPQYWADFGAGFGAGRQSVRANTVEQMSGAIAAARAIYTVNGIVAALACCTWQGKRIGQELHFIHGKIPDTHGARPRNFQLERRKLLEMDAVPKAAGVIRHSHDLAPIDSPA